jgi:hypothetical protein
LGGIDDIDNVALQAPMMRELEEADSMLGAIRPVCTQPDEGIERLVLPIEDMDQLGAGLATGNRRGGSGVTDTRPLPLTE